MRSKEMFSTILLLTTAMFITGCAADGGPGREGSPVWFMRTSPEEQAQYFIKICSTYGYEAASPEMKQCVAEEARNAKSNASRQLSAVASSDTVVVNNYNQWSS